MKSFNFWRLKVVMILALLYLMPDSFAQDAVDDTVRVRVHVARTKDGTNPRASEDEVSQMIVNLNNAYSDADIYFKLCGIYYFDNNTYYSEWDPYDSDNNEDSLIDALGNNYQKHTLNIFITELREHLHGHSNWPEDFMDLVEVDMNSVLETTVPHEVGHYFGLLHTRDTQFGAEYVDGTNSLITGDLISDTPAEPSTNDDDWNHYLFSIREDNDDAEEKVDDGSVNLSSHDLELVKDGNNLQIVGLRFDDVNLDQGFQIQNAYIQFQVDETNTSVGDCNLTIHAEDVDNSAAFTTDANNISNRTTTDASVAWSPYEWVIADNDGFKQRIPDVKDLLQEVVNRENFASGNAVSFIITGEGNRTAESKDGSQSPLLYVNNCVYYGTATDGHRDTYRPDGKNFMSDAPAPARSLFSAGQISRIRAVLNFDRYYLKYNDCTPPEDVTLHCDDNQILTISDFPHTEDFERTDDDSWMSDFNLDYGWSYGPHTPSSSTGADEAQSGTYFRFLWASKHTGTAGLVSPCYDLHGKDDASVDFYYHMYGDNIGRLTLEVTTDNGDNWVSLFTVNGEQHNSSDADWTHQEVSLRDYVGNNIQLRIKGTTDGAEGDICIDHITVKIPDADDNNDDADNNDDGDDDGNDDGNDNQSYTFKINADSDDAEEYADADYRKYEEVDTESSDLELADEDGKESHRQIIGMRFTNINIPQGTNIVSAYIQFTVDETSDGACDLTIQAEDVDSSATFAEEDNNISNRAKTDASVNWKPDSWDNEGDAGAAQKTPDIKDVIQEVVNRNGFKSGNPITIIISGSGTRVAESHDGDADHAPVLHITTGQAENAGAANNSDKSTKIKTNINIREDLGNNEIKLYPNPVKSTLHIEGLQPESTITILSMKGAVIKTVKVNSSSSQINVSDLKNGMYLLRYFDGSSYKVERFAKE